VHFHFTPTRSSWLNQIETWFSILQGQSLNGASFTSLEELQEHIDRSHWALFGELVAVTRTDEGNLVHRAVSGGLCIRPI